MYIYFLIVFFLSNSINLAFSSEPSPLGEEQGTAKHVHNLLWVYKKEGLDEKKYLSPNGDMLSQALEWAQLNPTSKIHVNYDGEFVSDQAIKATTKTLANSPYKKKVRLKNIRDIYLVNSAKTAFFKERSMDCRVDLVRVIKSYEDLKKGGYTYSSYADCDVTPCSLSPILKEKSADLKNYGMVMLEETRKHSSGHAPRWENGFHIFYKDKDFLSCLYQVLIQPSINRLRLISHIKGVDKKFPKQKHVKDLKLLMGISDFKKRYPMEKLENKEHVYSCYEKVMGAFHNKKDRIPYCILYNDKKSLDINLNSNKVWNRIEKRAEEYSLETLLCHPGFSFSIELVMKEGSPTIIKEGCLYIPTTHAIKATPSKILSEQ